MRQREPGDDDDRDDPGVDDDGTPLMSAGALIAAWRLGIMKPPPPTIEDTRTYTEAWADEHVDSWDAHRAEWLKLSELINLRLVELRDEVRAARAMGVDASPQCELGLQLRVMLSMSEQCERLCVIARAQWRSRTSAHVGEVTP